MESEQKYNSPSKRKEKVARGRAHLVACTPCPVDGPCEQRHQPLHPFPRSQPWQMRAARPFKKGAPVPIGIDSLW